MMSGCFYHQAAGEATTELTVSRRKPYKISLSSNFFTVFEVVGKISNNKKGITTFTVIP